MKLLSLLLALAISFPAFSQSSKKDPVDQEVSITSPNATLKGSLMTPKKLKKPIPVVLIISGSGPTDRDGNNPMMQNNSLKMLAQQLAKANIASLRYDKRGVGASADSTMKEENLRFEHYAQDAAAWLKMLRADKRFSKVYVLGHSEGSLLGMLAAQEVKVDGYISLAGPGRRADVVLKEQLAGQPDMVKTPCYAILDSLAAGKTVPDVSQMLYSLFRPGVQPYMISWFKHDPALEIKKINAPALILQGDRDLQVSVVDANFLSAAEPKAQLVVLKGVNHVLKNVSETQADNIASYSNPTLPLSEVLVKAVVGFVNRK